MATAVMNYTVTAGNALPGNAARAMDTSTQGTNSASSSSGADSSSATISANDFLTLLVTEMQNQDPTADTDPNEYIDQLVQVNSLEQLIDINQTLSTDLGGASGSGSGASAQITAAPAGNSAQPANANAAPTASSHKEVSALPVAGPDLSGRPGAASSPAVRTPGNLSVPRANAAAERVAHALDGRARATQ